MAQKVKTIDVSGVHQTVNTTTIASVEIRDVLPDQDFSVTIIDSNGVPTTYYFTGGREKRG